MTKAKKVLWTYVAILLFCGFGSWGLWRFSEFGQADADLSRTVAEARSLGLPWLAKDMAQNPPVKEEENAAPLVLKAAKLLKDDLDLTKASSDLWTASTYDDEPAQSAALRKLEPWLSAVRRAADKPRCDFHRDWDEGYWMLLPEFSELKNMAKALAASALAQARAGKTDAALADLRRAAQMGSFAASDPILIGMLVRVACDAIALSAVERMAEAWHSDPVKLAKLRRAVESLDVEADLEWALRGEVYVGVSLMRNFPGLRRYMTLGILSTSSEGEDIPQPKTLIRTGEPRDTPARVILCRHLQFWIRVQKELVPADDPAKLGRQLDDRAEKEAVSGWSRRLSSLMLPVFAHSGESLVKARATKAVNVGLAAVLEFRARNGRFPRSTAEAGVTIKDPFSGKLLGLVLKGETCRVYSVGPDKKDNHGVRQSEALAGPSGAKEWDLVASYPAYREAKPKYTMPAPGPAPSSAGP